MSDGTLVGFPLSPQQQRIWRLAERAGGTGAGAGACRARLRLRLTGPLAPPALRAALAQVVAAHSILRTRFDRLPGMSLPVQVPLAPGEPEAAPLWIEEAVTPPPAAGPGSPAGAAGTPQAGVVEAPPGTPEVDGQSRARRVVARLTRQAAAEHVLEIDLPALCADAVTLENLAAELADAYGEAAGAAARPQREAAGREGEPAPPASDLARQAREAAPQSSDLMRQESEPARHESDPERQAAGGAEALPYVQYAAWQNELLAGEDAAEGRAFWNRQRLAEIPPLVLPLGGDVPEEVGQAPGGPAPAGEQAALTTPTAVAVEISPAVARAVAAAAAAGGLPVEVFVLAAWQVLLWRLTCRDELLSGRLDAGRDHEMLHGACGPFARLLPVRLALAPHLPWSEITRRLALWLDESGEWQDWFVPTDALAGEAEHFAAGFAWEERRAIAPAAAVRFTVESAAAAADRFDLLLAASPAGTGLALELRCDAARVPCAAAAHLGRRLEPLLASAAARPAAALAELDLLHEAERQQLAFDATGPSAPRRGDEPRTGATAAAAGLQLDPDLPLHRLFEAQAARSPGRLAVAGVDGERCLTFGELNAGANRLARYLRRLGVEPEVPVGLLLPRSPAQLVALWGTLKAGGACLPLDPAHPAARLAGMLAEARATLVLTGAGEGAAPPETLAELAASGAARLVDLDDRGDPDGAAAAIARQEPLDLPDGAGAENLAYVIHTSGTSGRPKGVMVEHRAVVNLARALAATIYARHLPPADAPAARRPLRVSLNAPLTFDASVKQWVQLLSGHTLQLIPDRVRLDAERCTAYLGEHGVDVLDCTPSQLRLLLAAGMDAAPGAPAAVLVGGEAIDDALWRRLGEIESAAPVRFYNVYGPTECTVDATARPRAGAAARPTLGRALAGVRTLVLDALRLPEAVPVPPGFSGELWIGGAGVARGYLGRPELTAERFRPDPFAAQPGRRAYRTGDLVRLLAGGEIEFLGRRDRQVKLRGFRIELEEIEQALAAHPAVRQAAVVLLAAAAGGSGAGGTGAPGGAHLPGGTGTASPADPTGAAAAADGAQLAAYAGLRRGEPPPTAAELRDWLRRHLPEPMVPALIAPLPELPLTAAGKVDYRALPDARQLALARAQAAYVAPRNAAERAVSAVWQEVLGVPVVGVEDNFFDLGGHSLLMVRAHGRLQEAFGKPISMVEMFRFPTVAALAEHLVRGEETGPSLPAVRARAAHQREEQERQRLAAARPRRMQPAAPRKGPVPR